MIDLLIEYFQKLPKTIVIVCKPLIFEIKYITKLLDIPANLPSQFSLSGQLCLHWEAATLKGLGEFQNKKF